MIVGLNLLIFDSNKYSYLGRKIGSDFIVLLKYVK